MVVSQTRWDFIMENPMKIWMIFGSTFIKWLVDFMENPMKIWMMTGGDDGFLKGWRSKIPYYPYG